MAKRGRPKEHSDDRIAELIAKFEEYIDKNDMPVIAEFAYLNNIDKTLIYDKEEFSTLRKKAIAKKEAHIEIKALKGEYNSTMAIFSLKQMGWRDKQEVESINHNTNQDITQLSPDERRARIDELNRRRGMGADKST